MRTIALKFSDKLAPPEGTIGSHQKIIDEYGAVWFGKIGARIRKSIIEEVLNNPIPRILLINSKQSEVFWATVTETSSVKPKDDLIPEYYRYDIDRVKTWFKITSFDSVQPEILNEYRVASSQRILMDSLTKGMGSSFIIEEKNE